MYNIKIIKNNVSEELLAIYNELPYNLLSYEASKHNLETELNVLSRLVFGLYRGNELVGFVSGYDKGKVWFAEHIYVQPKYRYKVKSLVDFIEDYLSIHGYLGWEAKAVTKLGKNMLEKFGARRT